MFHPLATFLVPRDLARLGVRPFSTFALLVAGVVFALLAVCRPAAAAADPGLRRGPRPSWVSPAAIDFSAPVAAPAATQNGRQYLLLDRQVRLDGGHSDSYWRTVVRITNESGLQDAAQVNLGFDPSSESVSVHAIVIHRDGGTLDRLDFDAIKVAERERDLERQVYDGRKSAVLFVSDLRVGDVLDYDFTVRRADPTLGGRYEGAFGLGASEPIEHLRCRLIAPLSVPIHVTLHAFDPAKRVSPETEDVGSTREYRWDLHDVPAYPPEDDTPAWIETIPWAQIGQFESWGEVAQWGATLFSPRDPGPAVRAWVADARRQTSTPETFALRALRFVQDEVRYVGVEVGISRRKPADPGVVFARRYGDCKDKVALLVALLTAGGVEALPALVNPAYRASVAEWGPSAAAFTHAIVRAKGADGTVYWLDPTISLEGGSLGRYQRSSYERALTLDASTSDLEATGGEDIPPASPQIVDHFHVADPGSLAETTLDSDRSYIGPLADAMRAVLRAQTLEQTTKYYRQLYVRDYPEARDAAPLELSDEREQNVIRVTLHLALPKFWTWNEKTKRHEAPAIARALEPRLERPSVAGRKAPLGVPYPFHETYRADFELPFELALVPERTTARTGVFDFSFTSTGASDNRSLSYFYDLAMRGPQVEVADLPGHLTALDKARPTVFRSLTYRGPGPSGVSGIPLSIVVLCGVLSILGAALVYRHEPKVDGPAPDAGVERPIRGWLLILGFSVLVAPFLFSAQLATSRSWRLVTAAAWENLTSPDLPGYRPATAFVGLGEIVGREVLCAYLAVVAVLFVQRRRTFPFHFVVCTLAVVSYALVDQAMGVSLNVAPATQQHGLSFLLQNLVYASVWCTCVLNSQRVRETFVRSRRRERPSVPAERTMETESEGGE